MDKNNFKACLKVFFCIVLILIFKLNVFGYLFGNGSGKGYSDGTLKPGSPLPPGLVYTTPGTSFNIEAYVQDGGGYFLNAYSFTLSLLNQVEMSDLQGIDYEKMKVNAFSALQNIRSAVSIYTTLVDMADNTPYNSMVIEKLKTFDYQIFMEKNNLNREIFRKVAGYLSTGDITGMYRRILREILILETLLTSIHNDTTYNRQPELQLLWKTNEVFSETLLFGQYAARIFYTI